MLNCRYLLLGLEIGYFDEVISAHWDDLFTIARKFTTLNFVWVDPLDRMHHFHLSGRPYFDIAILVAAE